MSSLLLSGRPVRVVQLTPKQVALVAQVLGADGVPAEILLVYKGGPGGDASAAGLAAGGGSGLGEEGIVVRGRLRYRPGFEDVWVGGVHYNLRGREKARLCLQFLVEQEAFDAKSARHLVDEIDVFVRGRGGFARPAAIKIAD